MKKIFYFLSFLTAGMLAFSCSKDDHHDVARAEVIKRWTVRFSAAMENPVTAGHSDSGTLNLLLYADNSLTFDFRDSSLTPGDALTGAQLRAGDPLTNGPLVLNLNPRISGTYLSGSVVNVRQTLVDSLLNDNNNLYFEIQSARVPAGVARAQLNMNIIAAYNITLLGKNEVPPVTTTTTGNAYLRLTADQILYSKVTVANVEVNDVMNAAHIHKGATGVNGPIIVPLVASPSEFGVVRKTTVDQATFNSLLNDALYVNAHSVLYPGGKIRGQIR